MIKLKTIFKKENLNKVNTPKGYIRRKIYFEIWKNFSLKNKRKCVCIYRKYLEFCKFFKFITPYNARGNKYISFISFTFSDLKYAKELQTKLEYYRIPNKVKKEYNRTHDKPLSNWIRPIFLCTGDLEGFDFEGSLFRKLDRSSSLIVVCSPNVRDKKWVDREIKHFVE